MIIIYSLDAPKSILETEKTIKTLSSRQIYLKKTQKTLKNPLGWFFLKPEFFQPCLNAVDDPRFARLQRDEKTVGDAEEGGDEAARDPAAHNWLGPGARQTLHFIGVEHRRTKKSCRQCCGSGSGSTCF